MVSYNVFSRWNTNLRQLLWVARSMQVIPVAPPKFPIHFFHTPVCCIAIRNVLPCLSWLDLPVYDVAHGMYGEHLICTLQLLLHMFNISLAADPFGLSSLCSGFSRREIRTWNLTGCVRIWNIYLNIVSPAADWASEKAYGFYSCTESPIAPVTVGFTTRNSGKSHANSKW
jgi:hypothetical protein